MKETAGFEVVNPHAAGIDVGSQKIFVSIDGSTVVNFETFTTDYKRCINYLKENGIARIAMEATGVYWIAFHEMLEQVGIEVCLVNPKEVRQVKGRKTDVKDCQWIQRLFSTGLIRQSYVPTGKLKELRMINREREDIIGNYNSSWLFLLQQNFEMWKRHEQHLHFIDKKIEELLDILTKDLKQVHSAAITKPIRHHKPQIGDLHQKLLALYGVNVSTISGLTDYTLLKLVGETGNDLSRFPTAKHFISWCQLSPRLNQSGKHKKSVKSQNRSKAGQLFREAAQTLLQSKKIAIGVFMRRIRSKKGPAVAIKAGARKLAYAYYNIITKGIEYVEEGVRSYDLKIRSNEIKLIHRLAEKHKIQLLVS